MKETRGCRGLALHADNPQHLQVGQGNLVDPLQGLQPVSVDNTGPEKVNSLTYSKAL